MYHGYRWSVIANNYEVFYQGITLGGAMPHAASTQNAFNRASIGSYDFVPNWVWHGWIAHCAFFGAALTAADVTDLFVLP